MTSPIPSAPFEKSYLNDNDEAVEQYLSLLGDYRIYYQDLPKQIPSLIHNRPKQEPNSCDEHSVGSETTTTLSLHTVPFSVTSMVDTLHPPFAAVTPLVVPSTQPASKTPLDPSSSTTTKGLPSRNLEITPSTAAETLRSSSSASSKPLSPGELPPFHYQTMSPNSRSRMDDFQSVPSGRWSLEHFMGDDSKSHASKVVSPPREHAKVSLDHSCSQSEQAVTSWNMAADLLGGSEYAQKEAKRLPEDEDSQPMLARTRSVSSTSHHRLEPARVPKWIRVPTGGEHRTKAWHQRVQAAEQNALDLSAQLAAAHALVDALWEIIMGHQSRSYHLALDPEQRSTTYMDIFYLQAAMEQMQFWRRYSWWWLPFRAAAAIVAISYFIDDSISLVGLILLIVQWFHVPKLRYSHSLD